ncbi:hypothetical protein S40285_04993 [Stachybotrys chlorohalonatus IBT 40285]|uniref:nitric oxide dioxygenase n=1 Tax=Stachybotrys chlorohalonatus (strain IBT 40285) TaxID=1283841 RepID=A0A084QRU7_STAC4|nr:hypothetical protein S40285_04993 [Stachybotrys chlorohalonata IBT 40285]
MALTQEQINIVKSTAPILREHGKTITTTFYHNMLNAHPELKNIFSLRNQQTGAQPAALANAVLAYAMYIDDLGKLSDAVNHIAQKHVSLFIQPDQYAIVGEHLVGAFVEVLGDALTPEVKDAWVVAYGQLADIFINAEKALYDEQGEWQDWRKFKIVKKEQETDTVMSFYLAPTDGKPLATFRPGYYVSVQVPLPQLKGSYQSRQFSLSEAPSDKIDHYRISVKREYTVEHASVEDMEAGKVPGVVSNLLHNQYKVGDEVELSPPHGDFYLDEQAVSPTAPIVLLSAGVGATPNMSILQTLLSKNSTQPITWAHAARYSKSACFSKAVRSGASTHDNLKARIFVKNVAASDRVGNEYDFEGRLDMERLEAEDLLYLNNTETEYYICGPHEWMTQTRDWLAAKGVPKERLHLEIFHTGGL